MANTANNNEQSQKKSLNTALADSLREVGQTFVHLAKAPRALWGINLSFLFEGLAYFGVLTILGKYLSEDVGLSDIHAGWVYSVFTGGITGAMLVLGGVSDKIGVRRTLLVALACLVLGRVILGASGSFFPGDGGAASPRFAAVLVGLLCVVVGFSMYQPAAYAGVRLFTNKKTAAIGFAMIYAVMNLGAFFSGLVSPPVRQALGMPAVFWTYAVFTFLALLAIVLILTRKVAAEALEKVKADNARFATEDGTAPDEDATAKPELAPSHAKKRGWDPATIGFALLLVVGGVGLLFRAVAEPTPPMKAALQDHAERVMTNWAKLSSPDEASRPSGLSIAQALAAANTESMAKPVIEALLKDGVREPDIDGQALEIARAALSSDAALLTSLAGLDNPTVPATANDEKKIPVRDMLRSQALTTMAAAYGLARRGAVNDAVLQGLRMRQKEVDEGVVAMTNADQERAIRLAGQPPQEMLASLADALEETAASLSQQLPPQPGLALATCLRADASLNRELAHIAARPLTELGASLVRDLLLSQATTGFDQARLLVRAKTEAGFLDDLIESLTAKAMQLAGKAQAATVTLPSFAGVHVEARAARAIALSDDMLKAFPRRPKVAAMRWLTSFGVFAIPALLGLLLLIWRLMSQRPDHPLHNRRFTFFIFVLIPVQTLFAHNWLTLPYYIDRAFSGTKVGANFEFFSNLNPVLIFVLTPLIAALTASANVYRMLIIGTLVMAIPTFLLVLPPNPTNLILYIVLMTIGEAMWQPRFFQLVAEIAPEGKTGTYMGIAQLPWFLTKLVTGLYSGWFVAEHLPKVGPQNPELMWLIYACIAITTPVGLLLARSWMGSYLEKKPI